MNSNLFLFTFSIALICCVFLGHIVLYPAGIGTNKLTLKQVSFGYLFFGSIGFIYSNRKRPPYDALWKVIWAFLFVLLSILVWGYIKDRYLSRKK